MEMRIRGRGVVMNERGMYEGMGGYVSVCVGVFVSMCFFVWLCV